MIRSVLSGRKARRAATRRGLLATILLAAIGVATFAPLAVRAAAPKRASISTAPKRPNIVVIVPDDLGWRDIGYHGSDVRTPHLDRLAAAGVRLEQHYVYPTCSPTRVALLTGRGPSRFGVLGPIGGKSSKHLPADTMTLPGVLGDSGYATHIVGKWHLGLRLEFGPQKYGFESSYGYLHGQIDPYTHRYKFGDRTWHRNGEFIDEEGHATDLISDEAVRFIREAGEERPFFLYVAYSVPHFPLDEPESWIEPYGKTIDDPWRRLFAASVTHMDAGVGRIVEALESSGHRERTLIVFVSDNGGQRSWGAPDSQYDGRYEPHRTLGNNEPLRGWKGDLYEGGIRVPAFVNWPGKLPAGRKVTTANHVLDWLPTLCEVAAAPIPPDRRDQLEGQSIWSSFHGEAPPTSRILYWKTGGAYALREGDWKLITDRSLNHKRVFDLAEDPHEETDLADERPERTARLLKLLEEQRRLDP